MATPTLYVPVQEFLKAWYSLRMDDMPSSLVAHVQRLQRGIEQCNAVPPAPLPTTIPVEFLGEKLGYADEQFVPQLQAACKGKWALKSVNIQMGEDQSLILDFGPRDV